jgi:hypothetical protein
MLGEFREGVVMTRFYSSLALEAGANGSFAPFAESQAT